MFFDQVFKYVQEMLPSVRVIRGLRVSKDICPLLRWSEARPVLQSNDSQSPAEPLLCCGGQDHKVHLHHPVGVGPGMGSLGPSSAMTLSKES